MAVLEDEDINESISTPEMGTWEGIIEVRLKSLAIGSMRGYLSHSTWLQVICQTEFKTQVAYRVRGPVTYGKITALVRMIPPSRLR